NRHACSPVDSASPRCLPASQSSFCLFVGGRREPATMRARSPAIETRLNHNCTGDVGSPAPQTGISQTLSHDGVLMSCHSTNAPNSTDVATSQGGIEPA